MHNAETSVGLTFVIIWELLEQSVLLEKRITLMEVVTSMCLSCGNGDLTPDDPMFLMSEVATQTSKATSGMQDRLTTIASKTGTSSLDHSRGRAEVELRRLATSGLRSSLQTLKTSFGVAFGSWIQRHFAQATLLYGNTQTGNTLRQYSLTSRHPGSNLHLEQFLTWLNGRDQVWVLTEVSVGGPRRMWGGRFAASRCPPTILPGFITSLSSFESYLSLVAYVS